VSELCVSEEAFVCLLVCAHMFDRLPLRTSQPGCKIEMKSQNKKNKKNLGNAGKEKF